MRFAAVVLPLLVAGCLLAEEPGPAPSPAEPPPAQEPTRPAPVEFEEVCLPLELLSDRPSIVPGEWARLTLRLRNCGEETARWTLPYCAKRGEVEVRIAAEGRSWFLQHGPAVRELPGEPCETFPREIERNGTFEIAFAWAGTVARACLPEDGCPFGDWVEPGWYRLDALVRTGEGLVWTTNVMIERQAPRLPPYVVDGHVALLLPESVPVGSKVEVRARNDGQVGYRYRTFYAACDMDYFDERGYPFLIPAGTHCDIANDDVLDPGEEVTLFTWDLRRCTKDFWGCAESEPLQPGTYHVSATFHEDAERWWERPEAVTRTGASLRVT